MHRSLRFKKGFGLCLSKYQVYEPVSDEWYIVGDRPANKALAKQKYGGNISELVGSEGEMRLIGSKISGPSRDWQPWVSRVLEV